jgi:hypothetical protein
VGGSRFIAAPTHFTKMKRYILLCFLCIAATLPPIPKKHAILLSPKDAANRVTYVVPVIKSGTLMWDMQTNVGFVVEQKLKMKNKWSELTRMTNTSSLKLFMTNPSCYYRVGAYRL